MLGALEQRIVIGLRGVRNSRHVVPGVLARYVPGGYISIKLPAIDYRADLLDPVLERAARAGFRVHFDSLGPETVDRTNEVIARTRTIYPDLGCTLPGRWQRSVADADEVAPSDLVVRVVKGQWDDPEAPDLDPRAGFLDVVDRLAGRAGKVAVATHDVPLAARCLDKLRRAGTPVELELLHGLPSRRALAMARRRRVPVRIYVPYGESLLPYSVSYVRHHPGIAFWALWNLGGG